MDTNNHQQYGGLEYGLLVPRPTVKFRDLTDMPGVRVEPVNSEIGTSVKPVVITEGDEYDFEGVRSGGRSGLLKFVEDGPSYKVKGCRIEQALTTEGLYRSSRNLMNILYDPLGGQVISDADNELNWTQTYNEILIEEGFPVLHVPEAIIHYGKEYKADRMPEWQKSFYKLTIFKEGTWLYEFPYNSKQEELAPSVMRVKGDTRLHELYRQEVQNVEAASTVAYGLGLMAGAQQRLTEDNFVWSKVSPLHVANYVVFTEGRGQSAYRNVGF